LISPFSWKSERAAALLEQREHFTTANATDLEDQKPLSE
jgi:hypothetical protein